MSRNDLMLEEQLSPIRIASLELLTSDEKENIVSRIATDARLSSPELDGPSKIHGPQAKPSARRKTIHQSHLQRTPSMRIQRGALTSPREIPSLCPPDIDEIHTGSPSHRLRRKRSHNAITLSNDRYLNGNVEARAANRTIHVNTDEASEIKKRQIQKSPNNSSSSILEGSVTSNIIEPNVTYVMNSEGDLTNQEWNTPNFDFDHKSESTEALQRNDKRVPSYGTSKDIVKVDNADLSVILWESPDSKKVFTRRYINTIQEKHETEAKKLEEELASKNLLVSKLLARINENEQVALRTQRHVSHLKHQVVTLQITNESLELYSKQLDLDLARSVNKLKHKDSLLYLVNERLENARSRLHEDHERMSLQILELQKVVNELKTSIAAKDDSLTDLKNMIENSKKLLGVDLSSDSSFKDQIAALCNERANIRAELELLSSKNFLLTSTIRELEESNLAAEIAKEELNSKFVHLMQETRKVQEEMTVFETLHKELELDVSDKVSQIKNSSIELEKVRKENTVLEESLKLSEASNLQTGEERQALLERIVILQKQNEEKDRIISGDTKKLSELVEELNKQKQLFSDLKTSSPSQRSDQSAELLNQIAGLKRQISNAQQKTDERIQEVAEQLFHQYSKKHELKVNQLKEKYEAKLEEKSKQLNSKERQLESLESRLKTGEKEKNYLFHLLEKTEKRD